MVVKRGYIYHLMLLAALGAYVLDTVRDGIQYTMNATERMDNLRRRKVMEERMLEVTKDAWPECINLRMTALDCKDFIDNEIYNLFTERDRYVRSIIIGKRTKEDKWYNAVVIQMGDDDMVQGRDGDGMIYYDFKWDGSGELATNEQQAALPPIQAAEPGIAPAIVPTPAPVVSAIADPSATDPYPSATTDDAYAASYYDDYLPPEEEAPLVLLDKEIDGVTGSTIDEFITSSSTAGTDDAAATTDTAIINGGVLTTPEGANTPEGDAKITDALNQELTIQAAGERDIPPIDCSGLTGESCCLLVKLTVRDSDRNGNAIQCSLDYVASSQKKKYWLNHRGKKVHIFANHNNYVSKVPRVVGGWPNGIGDEEFTQWLLSAGNPPLILQ